MKRRVKTLVFDVSGVLRDSKQVMKKSYEVAFAEAGVDVKVDIDVIYKLRGLPTFNDLRNSIRLLVGTKGDIHGSVVRTKTANELLTAEMNGRPVDDALTERIRTSFRIEFSRRENHPLVTILPGVEEGIPALAKRYTLGVLSNSTKESLQRDLGHLATHFSFMVCDAAKPDPAVYLDTLRKHAIDPEETAYVGDALSDVQLAKASNSVSVALLSGMGTEKHLQGVNPDFICKDFTEFTQLMLDHAEGSPATHASPHL
ncbi:Pyrophosphatase PpaX [Diplonema papillatum]|nr:Pyrophosphatase PpaX [Diplonema papillatum]